MLSQIGVHQQHQEAGVEELGDEDNPRDGTLLLTVGVFTNPLNQLNDYQLENDVNSDNDECYGLSHDLGKDLVNEVVVANGRLENDFALLVFEAIHFSFLVSVLAHIYAETLEWPGKMSELAFGLCLLVYKIFVDSVSLPEINSLTVLLGELFAIKWWILTFELDGGSRAHEDEHEGASEHQKDDDGDHQGLSESVAPSEVTVLPDNVSWLRRAINLNFLSEELSILSVFWQVQGVIVVCGSVHALLGLKSDKD